MPKHSAPPSARWKRPGPPRAARRLMIPAALSLLTACSADRVVVQPLAPPPVAKALLAPVKAPACSLTPGAQAYHPQEITAALECWRAALKVAADKHAKLASAVSVREAKTAEALKAAVR